MKRKTFFLCCIIATCLINVNRDAVAQERNWTHFRGTRLDGIADVENAPIKWGNDQNLLWKTEIHGKGWSSPVVYENQVWITTGTDDGKELFAVCVDYITGKIIHDIKVFSSSEVPGKHSLNSYATPTPCIEKGFVYVHYGSLGTACINTTTGSVVWKRTDLKCNHVQGPASSPVIYKNLLVLHYEGTDVRYIVALDKVTGKSVWRTDRPEEPYKPLPEIGKKAYITPLILNVKGRDLLISNGSAICIAYEPETGKEVWSVTGGAESTVSMPFTEKGIVYYYTGFMVDTEGSNYSEIIAVNPDGKGDITKSNVVWKKRVEPMQLLTPVIRDGLIYTVDTKNNLICIDASTGKDVYTSHYKSSFNASPVYAAGNIYLFSTRGETVIIKAGRKLENVAQNQIDGQIWATPAILRNAIILRTDKYLYRIGK
jgi:outer membrane protein assembly factor BamB